MSILRRVGLFAGVAILFFPNLRSFGGGSAQTPLPAAAYAETLSQILSSPMPARVMLEALANRQADRAIATAGALACSRTVRRAAGSSRSTVGWAMWSRSAIGSVSTRVFGRHSQATGPLIGPFPPRA